MARRRRTPASLLTRTPLTLPTALGLSNIVIDIGRFIKTVQNLFVKFFLTSFVLVLRTNVSALLERVKAIVYDREMLFVQRCRFHFYGPQRNKRRGHFP